ncbi:MAG: hypothetical protein L7V30_02300 [Gammaproteobacteria bacterium]|jgi:hypothetical protein|nr:hypothetical protein [Gammaproteobacteria bacterium]
MSLTKSLVLLIGIPAVFFSILRFLESLYPRVTMTEWLLGGILVVLLWIFLEMSYRR